MKTLMQWLGWLLVIAGVCLGAYTGIWWALVGGVVDLIEVIKAPVTTASAVGVGMLKIVASGLIGWATVMVAVIPGSYLLHRSK
jgi:hypothetical protein